MSERIWKYEILPGKTTLSMPSHARVLSVGVQGDMIVLWALVNPEYAYEQRQFRAFGTGWVISDDDWGNGPTKIIGTVQQAGLVWHIFEVGA